MFGFRSGLNLVMPTLRNRRWLLVAIFVPLAVVALFFLWPEGTNPPAPRYVSVAYAGTGQGPLGDGRVEFSVSNICSFPVQCRFIGPQQLATNRSGTRTNVGWAWRPGWHSVSLRPRECIIVAAEPPTNGLPWRFAVSSERPRTLRQQAAEKLEPHLPRGIYWLLAGDPRSTRLFHSQVFFPGEFWSNRQSSNNECTEPGDSASVPSRVPVAPGR